MNLNLLVRGQSNAILMMDHAGETLRREVERLLGFDGVRDTVSLVYEAGDRASSTAFGGTALIGDWLERTARGWRVGELEAALLRHVRELPDAQRVDPTAVLWFHSEYDSVSPDITTARWVSAVRFEARQLREALGQGAADTPYLFVSAMPYDWRAGEGHQAIRRGMEQLAADASFNGHIAARIQDIDADGDDWDGNPGTPDHGGGHIGAGDAQMIALRAARSIAEALAGHAKPGSPVAAAGGNIADEGPEVIRATRTAPDTLRLDVRHDGAAGFAALDPDAAAGAGWSVIGRDGATVWGTAARIQDADTLVVTFSDPLPAGGRLFYGWGYGRIEGEDRSGRGNAVYDTEGLPVWVRATGLAPVPAAVNDRLSGSSGGDSLAGHAGNDTLHGLRGDDTLNGGAGADRLVGGYGRDVIVTGSGADRVVFLPGHGFDRVTDFRPGTDRLELPRHAAGDVTLAGAERGGVAGLDVLLPGGEGLFLEGVAALGPRDLIFG